MNSFDSLRTFASKYVSLTDSEFDYVASMFVTRSFNKKQKLLELGEVEQYLNFIDTGLARMYFIRGKEEVVMDFSIENEIICCFDSYWSGQPSTFYAEALEPLNVFSITKPNLDKLFDFSPKLERLGRLYATEEYLKKANFDYNRVRVPSQERFNNFVRENGHLIMRVPQKYLASYLDIQPETFSRMKHFTK